MTTQTLSASDPHVEPRASWVPMVAIALGQMIMSFNVASLPVAMGGMVQSFGVPPTTVATGIVAYSMLVAGFVMLGAKLAQRFGALRVFRGAVVLFFISQVMMTFSPSAVMMISAQALCGAAGAVIVAAWLVEEKKSIIENLAPVLTAIFTPLFAVMLLVSAVVYAVAGIGRNFDRDLLTVFDVLLLVVLGLVVYGISARDSNRGGGAMDVIRLVAVGAAILLDILVLVSMFARVGELGLTANRVAALGLNLVLLVNLAVTAWLTGRLLAGRAQPVRIERWQTGYLPVFAGWVLIVVLALPPLFGFV